MFESQCLYVSVESVERVAEGPYRKSWRGQDKFETNSLGDDKSVIVSQLSTEYDLDDVVDVETR